MLQTVMLTSPAEAVILEDGMSPVLNTLEVDTLEVDGWLATGLPENVGDTAQEKKHSLYSTGCDNAPLYPQCKHTDQHKQIKCLSV